MASCSWGACIGLPPFTGGEGHASPIKVISHFPVKVKRARRALNEKN
jgi:hypothetical protein